MGFERPEPNSHWIHFELYQEYLAATIKKQTQMRLCYLGGADGTVNSQGGDFIYIFYIIDLFAFVAIVSAVGVNQLFLTYAYTVCWLMLF